MTLVKPATPSSLVYPLPSILDRLEVPKMFPTTQPLEIELGSGDGTFLATYAARHPERNFIGVERLLGRLKKIDRKGRRAGLTNLQAVRIESSYFLEYLLPAESVAALHIYFPDPWPKRKHRHFRLINERFPALAATVLEPGGVVYLRTDDADYFAQMRSVFAANRAFRSLDTPLALSDLLTDFEREFLARGSRHDAWPTRGSQDPCPPPPTLNRLYLDYTSITGPPPSSRSRLGRDWLWILTRALPVPVMRCRKVAIMLITKAPQKAPQKPST